ncbi:hypothetical protein Hypma_010815 [Hypsizygus marmoreus]|uniref:Ricin B lectin domain-containing protein n=1 Tax=Hypsizygus marmoreus TaxID=39966 RepID=A0A369JRP0_HYPMA|nr:hypothetical protein Hypma_010815 [Hypsizygus marmoreus]
MSIQSGNTYKLVNVKGGTVIDLSGTDGTSVLGWNDHGGDNQKWVVEQNLGNQWSFKNVGSGRYLGLGEGHGNGRRLEGVEEPFGWDIFPDEEDSSVYRINAPGLTHFNVDLSDHGNSENGTPIALWGKWKGTNQKWRFEEA